MSSQTPIDLTQYVSNLDKNVYTIYNLPEEVIAVIFAYVSRSPASFRENLAKLLADDEIVVNSIAEGGITNTYSEKAAQFHEKWVVSYGHSSVAEHAVAHIGIEKISRLASAELELANTFNSFTEYSQRYQRPQRGQVYTPSELGGNPEAAKLFQQLNEQAFDTYEYLLTKLFDYLLRQFPPQEGESERRHRLRIEKIAFEDARYVLTLATLTSLGMTGNGRALRDTLVRLLSSPHQESRQLAQMMEHEISKVIPTLLKHVKPSDYLLKTRREIAHRKPNLSLETDPALRHATQPRARFVHLVDYATALDQAIIQLYISEHRLTYEQAADYVTTLSLTKKEKLVDQSLKHLRFFDHPMDLFRHLVYQMEMHISEANWHQLLRHNRGTAFSYGEPTAELGYTIPPHIQAAGLTETYTSFIEQATQIYEQMLQLCPEAAPYCVTNAHHRQVFASASLWELYHLINLRTSPEAQWDIAHIFTSLYEELKKYHPVLARYAQRRQ